MIPGTSNRTRSGALKIWLFGYTRDKKLRKRRRNCWKNYIELRLTRLLNTIATRCQVSAVASPASNLEKTSR
uniref:Uncharacterized protein n=1 Tax=Ignisphaera aggregans TaxID=334771 RepID=A0A7J2TAH9_9CREN